MQLGKYKFTNATILLVIIFIIFFFLFRWNSFSSPFERDEGEYAYSAWILRQGIMPYENSFMQKPPLIIYTYALGQMFDSGGVVSPRILSAIFGLLTTLIFSLIAGKKFGKSAGWVFAFLVTPMILLPYNAPFAANTEHFMLLPLSLLMAVYIFKNIRANFFHFFLSGVFAASTLLYKPIGLYLIIFIYCVWIWDLYKEKIKVGKIILNLLFVIIGGLTVTGIVLLPFIVTGTVSKVIESAVIYNLSYTDFEGFSFANIFNYIGGKYIKVYWPLYALVIYYLFKRPKKWWFYFGLFLVSVYSVFSSPMGHYYILVMPFWALICSQAIKMLASEQRLTILGKYKLSIVASVILFIMIFPFRIQFGLTAKDLNLWVYGTVNPFIEAEEVAGEISKITENNDYIFVAGSEPEIYFYSKRLSPTRFVITYPLNITSKHQERYQKEIIEDLDKNKPKVIVVSRMEHSGLWNKGSPEMFINYLNDLLNKEYDPVSIYYKHNNKGYLLKDFETDDLKNASLITYKRKVN